MSSRCRRHLIDMMDTQLFNYNFKEYLKYTHSFGITEIPEDSELITNPSVLSFSVWVVLVE